MFLFYQFYETITIKRLPENSGNLLQFFAFSPGLRFDDGSGFDDGVLWDHNDAFADIIAFDLCGIIQVGAGREGFDVLSIGMSQDWPVAVRHGATMVRIGTDIFGPREY